MDFAGEEEIQELQENLDRMDGQDGEDEDGAQFEDAELVRDLNTEALKARNDSFTEKQ